MYWFRCLDFARGRAAVFSSCTFSKKGHEIKGGGSEKTKKKGGDDLISFSIITMLNPMVEATVKKRIRQNDELFESPGRII